MKTKHLPLALVIACIFSTWINSARAAGTNILQIQNSTVITYTTNLTGNFVSPSTPFSDAVSNSINSPGSVAAADVNGDGNVDLVCANSGAQNPGTLTVLTNDGTGNFFFASTLNVGNEPSVVLAVDVNGDGKVDLVSANESVSTLTVSTNGGGGHFTVASSPAVGGLPTALASAIINVGGRLSLMCANLRDHSLTVLTNMGGGIFVSNATYNVGSHPDGVVAADVNHDGNVDLISANSFDNNLTVLTNNGSGVFGSNAIYNVGSAPAAVVATSVTGGGNVDLISANFGDNTLTVLTNNGSGHFATASTLDASFGVGNGPIAVTAADANGDGNMDLICANYTDNTLTVLTNDGSGGFVFASIVPVGNSPLWVAAADIDGDGGLDLIDADSVDNTLTVSYDLPTLNPFIVNGVTISWSTNSAGFILQQNTNVNTTNWVNVSTTPLATNKLNLVTAPFINGGQLFYRLRHP
jgi:hypothetical protein